MLSLIIITAVLVSVIVPNRVRFLLMRLFSLPMVPIRWIAGACRYYLRNAVNWSRYLLSRVGIQENFLTQGVGTIVVFGVALISVLADIIMLVLTLEGMGFSVDKNGSLFKLLSKIPPGYAVATALIGGATLFGILVLDFYAPEKFFPHRLDKKTAFGKVICYTSAIMFGLSIVIFILLGVQRYDFLTASTAVPVTLSTDEDIENNEEIPTVEKSATLLALLIFIALSTLIAGVIGSTSLPAFLIIGMVLLVLGFTAPSGIAYFITAMVDGVITVLFNLLIAVHGIMATLFARCRDFILRQIGGQDPTIGEDYEINTDLAITVQAFISRNDRPVGEIGQGSPLLQGGNPPANAVNREEPRPERGNPGSADGRPQDPRTEGESREGQVLNQFDEAGFNPLNMQG